MTSLQQQVQEMRKQFHATPWLRWAAVAIAVLGMAFVWQFLDGARVSAQQQAIDEESKLRRIRALEGQDIWLTREGEAKQLVAALEAQMPAVKTPGLAQAALQTSLRTMTESFTEEKGIRIAIEKAAEVSSIEGVVKVRATVSGAVTPSETMNLIRKIEGSQSLMVIESINITNDINKTANLSLNAYFRVVDPAPAP